ncbi:hypothetical protein D3C76_544700 [compost metagenome]
MSIDPFLMNFVYFVILILVIFTTLLITLGILRFFELYTHQVLPPLSTFYSNDVTNDHWKTSSDLKDSNNVALNYIKRNFIEDSENNREQTL